jgi:hypothetical protein
LEEEKKSADEIAIAKGPPFCSTTKIRSKKDKPPGKGEYHGI